MLLRAPWEGKSLHHVVVIQMPASPVSHSGDKWWGAELNGSNASLPLLHNNICNTTFVAAWKRPSGDINGTTHFRVKAGAASGPPGSIHLSAQHIGTFPVYSLHHILHQPTSLCSPSISLVTLFPPLGLIKPVRLPRPGSPQLSVRGWFYGLSPLLMAI